MDRSGKKIKLFVVGLQVPESWDPNLRMGTNGGMGEDSTPRAHEGHPAVRTDPPIHRKPGVAQPLIWIDQPVVQ